jgi:TonB family protein
MRFILLVLALGMISLNAATTPIKLLEGKKPDYPPGLKAKGEEGSAKIQFVVDETGAVTELEVLSETHPFFGMAAMEAVQQWKFRPAADESGPIRQTVAIPINFTMSVEEKINVAIGRQVFTDLVGVETIYDARKDFGDRIKPVGNDIWRGVYPPKMKGSGVTERIRVEFVITPEGKAVNPEIRKVQNKAFYLPAIIKVAQLQFEPVKKDGEAVYVKPFWSINFTEQPPGGKGKKK